MELGDELNHAGDYGKKGFFLCHTLLICCVKSVEENTESHNKVNTEIH